MRRILILGLLCAAPAVAHAQYVPTINPRPQPMMPAAKSNLSGQHVSSHVNMAPVSKPAVRHPR